MVMIENDLGVVMLNGYIGNNNQKLLPKSKKGTWEWTYCSSGRHLVRMHWMTIFVYSIFDILMTDEQASLVSACKDSYERAFGAHHPWIVRKAAGLGMRAAPSKETLKTAMKIKDFDELTSVKEGFKIVE